MSEAAHWQGVYSDRAADRVSWYQAEPTLSLEMIDRAGLPAGSSVVDVGGGASAFADRMLERGHRVTVIDLSAAALDVVRARIGDEAAHMHLIEGDITRLDLPAASFDLWHDRAVFHFLVTDDAQDRYVESLGRSLRPGGLALIATFDLDGPERCSGLPVRRWSSPMLRDRLGAGFEVVDVRGERHTTPAGASQSFQYTLLSRTTSGDAHDGVSPR